jgi:hypothetical protein
MHWVWVRRSLDVFQSFLKIRPPVADVTSLRRSP